MIGFGIFLLMAGVLTGIIYVVCLLIDNLSKKDP